MEWMSLLAPLLFAVAVGMFTWAAVRQFLWNRHHDRPTELELLRRADRRGAFEGELFGPLLAPFIYVARALPTPRLRDRTAERLMLAGNPNNYSSDEQLAVCCASAMMVALIMGVMSFLNSKRIDPTLMGAAAFGLLIGFWTPLWMLSADGTRRMRLISKSLPYALDLISLTMGAGSNFPDAVRTMIRGRVGDPLSDEFRQLLAEMDFGTPRPEALKRLSERVPLEDMRNIVASINQAETYGSSLTEVLKAQASLMRLKRSVAAEKAAAEAGVRMLLPMTLLLVGVLLLVFAPAVIRWKQGSLF